MFKKLTIGKKIALGFGSVVCLLLVVTLIAFLALNSSTNGFQEYRDLARNTNLTGRVQANMLMVRMNVKDFIITASDKDLQQFQDYWEKTERFMDQAKTRIADPAQARRILEVDRVLKEYKTGFADVTTLQGKRNEVLHGTLDVMGPKLEKDLGDVLARAVIAKDTELCKNAAEAMRHLLLGRLYVMKFIEKGDGAMADRVRREMAECAEHLRKLRSDDGAADLEAMVRDIADRQEEYLRAAETLFDTIAKRDAIIETTLDRIGPDVAAKIEDVKLAIKERQDTLGPQQQAANARAIVMISVVGFAALLVAVGLATFITRGITRAMATIIAGLQDGSNEVSSTAELVSDSAQGLADNSTKQAAGVEETSSSLEEISSMVKTTAGNIRRASEMAAQNSANTREAKSLSETAIDFTREGDGAMKRMSEAIEKIKASAEETERVVKTIDEIAFQTNLLALNAAVEAARAGEAGKGFAVVAEEVRNLAQRSAEAAKNTADMIGDSIKNAEGGVSVSKEATESFHRIGETVEKVAVHVGEIAAASEEQTRLINEVSAAGEEQAQGVEQINAGVSQIDDATQANAASAEELAASAEQLNAQTEELEGAVVQLQAMVGGGRAGGEGPAPRDNRPADYRGDSHRATPSPGRTPHRKNTGEASRWNDHEPKSPTPAHRQAQPAEESGQAESADSRASFPLDNNESLSEF